MSGDKNVITMGMDQEVDAENGMDKGTTPPDASFDYTGWHPDPDQDVFPYGYWEKGGKVKTKPKRNIKR